MTKKDVYPRIIGSPGIDARLEWENDAVLLILQALSGLIGPEVLAISVEVGLESLLVHVCLRDDNEQVSGELADIVDEFEAANFGSVEPFVIPVIRKYVGQVDSAWPGYGFRILYRINDRLFEKLQL